MGGTVSPMQSMSRGRCFASCCGVSCEVRSTAGRNAGATFCSCVAVGFGSGAAGGEGTFPSRGSVRASESQICPSVMEMAPRHRPAAGGWLTRGDPLPAKGSVSIPDVGERGPLQ